MEYKKLSEVAEIRLSSVDKKIKETEKNVKLCNFTDVYYNFDLDFNDSLKFMDATANDNEIIKFKLKKDDVVITKDSETRDDIGMACHIKDDLENTLLGYHCALIRPKDVDGGYLNICLQSKLCRNYFSNQASGSGQRYTLTEKGIGDVKIPMVSIEMQKKISNLIGNINSKIRVNNRINDNLEQQTKLLYDYWFTQFDFPNEEGKPYRTSGGKMIWNEVLKRDIPADWSVVPFLDIVSWESNSQPPKSEFVYEPKEGYVRFIQNRDYDSDTHKTYIPLTKNLSIVDRYDILMDKYGDAGAVRYGIEGAFNVALGKIAVHNPNYREYVRSFLESEGIYNYLHNSCMASTRASLSEANLSMLNIVIPSEHIVLKYEKMLKKIRDAILQNNDETTRLIELRDWLLPMLMNGQATIAD